MALIRTSAAAGSSAEVKLVSAIGGVTNGYTVVGDTYTHTSTSGGTGPIGTIGDLSFSYTGSNTYKVDNAGSAAVEVTNLVTNTTITVAAGSSNTFTSANGLVCVL